MIDLDDRWTAALLLGVVAGLMAVYLGWLNVLGLRGKVTLLFFRASIGAFSVATVSSMSVLAMIVGYLTPEREAIPVVENVGLGLIVLTVGSVLISLLCLLAGVITLALASKRRSFRI